MRWRTGKPADSATPSTATLPLDERVPEKRTPKAGNRAKLSALQTVPVDILFEVRRCGCSARAIIEKSHQIFALLHPMDLIRLSRTTKTVRALVMAKSARVVWMSSLASIPDLSPCPEDMPECTWARLVFEPICHVRVLFVIDGSLYLTPVQICSAPGVRNIMWQLRLRACSKCVLTKYIHMITRPTCHSTSTTGCLLRLSGLGGQQIMPTSWNCDPSSDTGGSLRKIRWGIVRFIVKCIRLDADRDAQGTEACYSCGRTMMR
jgi:hypothetical protein